MAFCAMVFKVGSIAQENQMHEVYLGVAHHLVVIIEIMGA